MIALVQDSGVHTRGPLADGLQRLRLCRHFREQMGPAASQGRCGFTASPSQARAWSLLPEESSAVPGDRQSPAEESLKKCVPSGAASSILHLCLMSTKDPFYFNFIKEKMSITEKARSLREKPTLVSMSPAIQNSDVDVFFLQLLCLVCKVRPPPLSYRSPKYLKLLRLEN